MPPSGALKTTLKFTPMLAAKVVGSLMLSLLGMYSLYRGKEEKDFKQMVEGAVLVLLSLFLFI
jgi:uncharacterized YccA/Bax inhibitor family protein